MHILISFDSAHINACLILLQGSFVKFLRLEWDKLQFTWILTFCSQASKQVWLEGNVRPILMCFLVSKSTKPCRIFSKFWKWMTVDVQKYFPRCDQICENLRICKKGSKIKRVFTGSFTQISNIQVVFWQHWVLARLQTSGSGILNLIGKCCSKSQSTISLQLLRPSLLSVAWARELHCLVASGFVASTGSHWGQDRWGHWSSKP